MTEMERFQESCCSAATFPRNLVNHGTYDHILRKYSERLDEKQDRLFCGAGEASVDLLESQDHETDFNPFCVKTTDEMQDQLRLVLPRGLKDPLCRFIFIHAPHSRAKLNTTRDMLMFALTYHQVMPAFLDFLFPFGQQLYAKDFHFSGFRYETRLSEADKALELPALGRSGRNLQMCFSLKSVEPSKGQRDWPWSIRQTAIYHSFDVRTGRTFWLLIKGNRLLRNRITAATKSPTEAIMSNFESPGRSFVAALEAHLMLCDWAGENWRWYINFLEDELQRSTRHSLSASVDNVAETSSEPAKVVRWTTAPIKTPHLMVSQATNRPTSAGAKLHRIKSFKIGRSSTAPATANPNTAEPVRAKVLPKASQDQEEFSFSDLQHIQFIEEKANETLLVLKVNANVLMVLKQHYRTFFDSDDCPDALKTNCKLDVSRFERRVESVVNDLHMQQSRLETLLRLLADRKTLTYGILDYRNIQANKHLAQKAQNSADKMELLTEEMHEIAKKTEQETVSMRIITLVTLFFLPGTFISTLMSTDIIRFSSSDVGTHQRNFSSEALKLYIAITLPMMFLTFMAWWVVYRYVNRKTRAAHDIESGSRSNETVSDQKSSLREDRGLAFGRCGNVRQW